MGVLSNLCICFKNCVWPLEKNEDIRTNSVVRFSAKNTQESANIKHLTKSLLTSDITREVVI
jgi:hypothetical protein